MTERAKDYEGFRLAHEVAAMLYAAMIQRGITVEELRIKIGWSALNMSRVLKAEATMKLDQIAEVFAGLEFVAHLTVEGFRAKPLEKPDHKDSP